ncbi:hypothetical protein ANN_23818 [Periplaneta americana]|uniref:Uncharacterized protein n=1 Tax=Periplaneta americana TaxID=6978 RepID=A0ABQ8SP77_PERAM|nr:hypothetical protein ANN_23818 [Periplaneta americana]
MAGLCEGGNEPPGSLKARLCGCGDGDGDGNDDDDDDDGNNSYHYDYINVDCSLSKRMCSDSELLTCPAVAGSQYRVAQGMFRLRDNSRNVGARSDEPMTAAVTLFSLFFMLYLELRWMKLVLETLTWLEGDAWKLKSLRWREL